MNGGSKSEKPQGASEIIVISVLQEENMLPSGSHWDSVTGHGGEAGTKIVAFPQHAFGGLKGS